MPSEPFSYPPRIGLISRPVGISTKRAGSSAHGICLEQGESDRNQDPAFDRKPVVARGYETPSRSDRLERGVVERVEARRIRNFRTLDGTVRADQHFDCDSA